ncbi:MAG: lipopolysaccharide biosynthesis protein [Sphingomonas sp.]|nr:MAG: lipopolysaccharide biosynthesis protein [Sphingomonas sp.]
MPISPYTPQASEVAQDRIDARALVAMFRRRLGIFLLVFLSILIIGLVLTFRQTPSYTAVAQVSLNVKQSALTPAGVGERPDLDRAEPSANFVDTQVEIIRSEAFARRVASALALPTDPRFTSLQEPHGIRTWITSWFTAPPKVARPTAAEAEAAAITYVQDGVTATRLNSTYALHISFSDTDPALAARIVNEFARQYTEGSLAKKQVENRDSTAMIARRAEDLRARWQAADAAEQRYRIQHNLTSTQGLSLTEQEISTYNQAVAAARAALAEDQARLSTARAQLRSGSRGDDVGEALGSSVVSGLRANQSALSAQVAELTTRYGARHPDVLRANSQLAAIDKQISNEIARVISNLAAKTRVSEGRLASLSGTLSGAQAELAGNNAATVELNNLAQNNKTARSTYESYLTRYQEQLARLGTEQADASVLKLAAIPDTPTSPNILLNLILTTVLGFGFGLVAAFLTEMAFTGLTTGDDIRSLRASITFAAHAPAKVIAITSALAQEGKTTTSICLARSMGLAGEKVVLVDCDLRRHGVSRFLRTEADRPGLMQVLRGEATLEAALVEDTATGMMVLPIAADDDFDGDLMIGDKMDGLLDALRDRFDVIVLDTAPVLPIADARLMLGKADVAVFVARWRKTPDHAIRSALRLLPLDRIHLAGIALTKVDIRKQARFGYGDSTYYYHDYKGYYA